MTAAQTEERLIDRWNPIDAGASAPQPWSSPMLAGERSDEVTPQKLPIATHAIGFRRRATAEDVPIYSEYAAQTYARDMVEVRGPRRRLHREATVSGRLEVKAGEPLYILDLRPYQADVAKARATSPRVRRISNSPRARWR